MSPVLGSINVIDILREERIPLPTVQKSTYKTTNTSKIDSPTDMHAAVDADWGGDTSHRRSVTGMIL
jgi:hypothetical protein